MSRKKFLAAFAMSAFLVGAAVPPAFGDAVGTGSFSIDIDLSNSFAFTGTLVFNDDARVVFGTPVNLGTQVGSGTVTGALTNLFPTSPTSGEDVYDFASSSPGALSFHAAGNFVCSPTGCADGSLGSFVSTASNITGSVVASLPPGLTYTGDGAASCCIGAACTPAVAANIQHCTGVYAMNAFEPTNTPANPAPETVPINGTFFDPLTFTFRDFQVDVTYQMVSSAGNTTVAGISNAAGTLPKNFALSVGGLPALFFDVSTTAAATGSIVVCAHYPDSTNDGIVDGTTVHETALRLFHQENNTLVDRTTSLDIIQNQICATVSSFSAFALAATIVGFVPPDVGTLACENLAVKNVGKLAAALVRCNSRAAQAGFAGQTRKVASDCVFAAQTKYDQANTKLDQLNCRQVAPCMIANLNAVHDQVQAALEGTGVQLYCTGQEPFGF